MTLALIVHSIGQSSPSVPVVTPREIRFPACRGIKDAFKGRTEKDFGSPCRMVNVCDWHDAPKCNISCGSVDNKKNGENA